MQAEASIIISFPLAPRWRSLGPAIVRVRTAKSAVACNHLRDALLEGPHAAIVNKCTAAPIRARAPGTLVGSARANVEQNGRRDRHYDEYKLNGSAPGSPDAYDALSIMLSLALDPGRSGFRPAVIRVRITKSAIARNDQRDALFQRSHAAIVPDVLPDVLYRAPRTLVGSAGANIQQHRSHHDGEDENESHDRLPTKR